MNLKKSLLAFYIALPVCTMLRFLQMFFLTEQKTGFFKPEFELLGNLCVVFIFVVCLGLALLGGRDKNSYLKAQQIGVVSRISALLVAVAILVDLIFTSADFAVLPIQNVILKVFGLAAAAFFSYFTFNRKETPRNLLAVYLVPAVYLVFKIIGDFGTISTLALIPDNVFLMGAYCLCLCSLVFFARLYIAGKATGFLIPFLPAALMVISSSLPPIKLKIAGIDYSHVSIYSNIFLLSLGLFIALFAIGIWKNQSIFNKSEQ